MLKIKWHKELLISLGELNLKKILRLIIEMKYLKKDLLN